MNLFILSGVVGMVGEIGGVTLTLALSLRERGLLDCIRGCLVNLPTPVRVVGGGGTGCLLSDLGRRASRCEGGSHNGVRHSSSAVFR